MWIVKLGGSLLGSPELPRWLETLVKISDGQVVIVPGGGLFADAVREAQQRTSVSDVIAHELALLAMDQFGVLLAGMNSKLVTASSELEIAERGWQHRCIVWLPSKMVLADDTVPKSWQVSSDSLSAWLANKIGAKQLVLVKSKSLDGYPKPMNVSLQNLQADDLIDEAFADFFTGNYQTWVVNKLDDGLFEQGLNLPLLAQHCLVVNQ
ncbi:MAG: uridylate kinase [Methylotenera sp.]|nr:uridylate kinase [Methylotenera sp.]MDO9233542.1 uridylate kinase [Methylotenera sp.]MDO9387969.1 uridylate kinase [Methylotenera sp.]MDP2103115.1 uridylate kinase [Methylotenera sp.]MDP2280074.1 uridylate kinase [Methylotenera sp.]